MINFLIGSLTTLISLYIGYTLGKGSSIIPEATQRQVRQLIRELPIKRDIGAVERPTAEDVRNYENPLVKDEEDEMSETFKKIIK
jgi:hypothetical protein